jgi:hypothetical protein
MPALGKLVKGTIQQATFEYDGETYNIWFIPSRFTPAMVSDLALVAEMGDRDTEKLAAAGARRFEAVAGFRLDSLDALIRVIVRLLDRWDVTNEDTSMYEITEANLSELPFMFLAMCLEAMEEYLNPTGDSDPEAQSALANS